MLRTALVFLFLLLIAPLGRAACNTTSCTDVLITRMYVTPSGHSIISTSGDESQLSCNAGSNGYITLRTGQSNYNATYALLLAAHTSQSPVWVRATTHASGSCDVLYVVSDK